MSRKSPKSEIQSPKSFENRADEPSAFRHSAMGERASCPFTGRTGGTPVPPAALPGIVADGDGSRITLQVVPRASRTEVVGAYGDDSLRLRLAAPPVDGKANAALVNWAAQAFGLPRAAVHLLHGAAGRRKVLELDFPDEAALHAARARVGAWMAE